MANASKVFKDDEDERLGRSSDNELQHITDIGHSEKAAHSNDSTDLARQEERDSLFNPGGDNEITGPLGPAGLRSAEDTSSKGDGKAAGLYNASDGKRGKASKLVGKLKGLRSKKWLLAGVGGGGAIALILILLLIFASSLKIPNLAQNITAYEFSRLSRQFSQTAERSTEETLAVEAADTGAKNSTYNALKAKYTNASGKVSETWSRLDNYRPQKVIQNLGSQNSLKLNFKGNNFLGGTLDGTDFSMAQQGGTRFVPVLKNAVGFKNNLAFSRSFAPALETSLKANEVGPIVRGIVANRIRKQLGITLIAWTVGKYQGKSDAQARLLEERDKITKVDGSSPTIETGKTESLNKAEQAAADAQAQTLSSDSGVQSVIDNGGVIQSVKDALGTAVDKTPLQGILNFANPVAAATPLCIVYDGSLQKSGPTMNNQMRQQQATYYYIASAADQQKNGSVNNDSQGSGLGSAVNATNGDLGDITQSNAEVRASGGTVDTSSNISPEASAAGEFSLFNAAGLPHLVSDFFNGAADNVCPILTNLYVQGGLTAANILIQFVPGADLGVDSTVAAGKTTSEVITREVVNGIAHKLIAKLVGDKVTSLTSKAGKLLYDTGKSATTIAAATVLAKLIVASRAGSINSGTAQGTDMANIGDSGGNIQANELERQQMFGRPLNSAEVGQSNQTDTQYISYQNSSKSFSQRYFATSNPNSLLSRVAIEASGVIKPSILSTTLHLGLAILHPITYMGELLGTLSGTAHAAGNPNINASNYGNVQFGWSQDEENLIDSNTSYMPLENQAVLDASGNEAAIAKKYAKCFGYQSDDSGNLTDATSSDGAGSLGTLLASGDIIRDPNANVAQDSGLCSPTNLGYKSSDPLAIDAQGGPQPYDMIFRWRLAQSYKNTFDQLTSEQNASS